MNKILLLLFFIFSSWTFSQNLPEYNYKPAQKIHPAILERLEFSDYQPGIAETEPLFQGGIHLFRAAISDKFDASAIKETNGRLTTTLYFVVEKDGSISKVTANGSNGDFNNEAERALKSIKSIWIPAKADGKPIRYIYKLPLAMSFN